MQRQNNPESEFSPRASGGQDWRNYWLDIKLLNEGKNFILTRSYEQFQDLLIQFSSSQCSRKEFEEDVIRKSRQIGEGREMKKGVFNCERQQRWWRLCHSSRFSLLFLSLSFSPARVACRRRRGQWPGLGTPIAPHHLDSRDRKSVV